MNKFTFNKDNHLLTNVAFMDEGSMVNASLFLNWLEAIDNNTKIVICGDHKQLPPIGFGNIFSDFSACRIGFVNLLTTELSNTSIKSDNHFKEVLALLQEKQVRGNRQL